MEWRLFKASVASSAACVCGRKRVGVANNGKKVTLCWNKERKDVIQATKVACKTWLWYKPSSLHSRYVEARKFADLTVKKSKMQSWENFGHKLFSNHWQADKLF